MPDPFRPDATRSSSPAPKGPSSDARDAAASREDVLSELLEELVDRTVRQYRIAPGQAESILRQSLEANTALRQLLAGELSCERLRRSAVFKRAASEAKRRVYYHLRSYSAASPGDSAEQTAAPTDPRQLLEALAADRNDAAREAARRSVLERHASTRERLATADEFYDQLFRRIEPPRRVLDVGCGVQPLMFPFSCPGAAGIECYLALDSAERDIGLVNAYARGSELACLRARAWNLAEGWRIVQQLAGGERFELALMMKLVPVLRRHDRRLLAILAEAPARTWVVTGSRISMTRRVSIERRERRALHEFVRAAGREVCGEFSAGEEFAWIVRGASWS